MRTKRTSRLLLAGVAMAALLAACGSDDTGSTGTAGGDTTSSPSATGGADTTTAPSDTGVTDTTTAPSDGCDAAANVTPVDGAAPGGSDVNLAVNPWTGSAVNAYVAKAIIEANLDTKVSITDIDENATWVGMDDGSIDAVLEVWPSGHAADCSTYVQDKGSVVTLGLLGPNAKIGWYVPSFVVEEHPELATWEGFKDPELAKLFATAESGDQGQFTMGDPSYVTYDEQIIANLGLPLKYVVAGSEAALLTMIDKAEADHSYVLFQFWQPHWKQSLVDLTEVKLPDVTQACLDSAASGDGGYACDYPVDHLYKAASAKLAEKNPAVFNLLLNFSLTTDQQNAVAAMIDGDGMSPDAAAQKWVDDNKDVWQAWLG